MPDTMTVSDQAAGYLRAAAGWLRLTGWTQGQYRTLDGALCATGALSLAVFGTADYDNAPPRDQAPRAWTCFDTALDAVYNRLGVDPAERETAGELCDELVCWNDTAYREPWEVVDLFQATAGDLAGRAP
jgi:hypothetical protein